RLKPYLSCFSPLTSLTFSCGANKCDSVLLLTGSFILVTVFSLHIIPIFPPGFEQVKYAKQLEVIRYTKDQSADLVDADDSYNQTRTSSPDLNITTFINGNAAHENLGVHSGTDNIHSDMDSSETSTTTFPVKTVKFYTLSSNLANMSAEELDHYKLAVSLNWDISKWFFNFEFSSEMERSFAISSFYLGAMFISVVTIFTSKFSTKANLILSSIILIYGGVLSAVSPNWILLTIGRFFLGMGSGIAGTMTPIFFTYFENVAGSESIAKGFRDFYPLLIPGGILLAGILQQYFLNIHYLAWRILNGGTAFLSIIAILFLLPKVSPQNVDSEDMANATQPLMQQTAPKSSSSLLNTIFGEGSKSAIVIICLHIFQQLSFINGYFSYTKEIFGDLPNISILLGVANVAGTFLNVAINVPKNKKDTKDQEKTCNNCFVDLANKIDTKYIGAISGAGTAVFSWVLFLGLFLDISIVKSVSGFGFIFFFALGFGPIPWMINPKITPEKFQKAYGSLGSIVNWLLSFMITLFTNKILSSLNEFAFLIFAVFCAAFALIMAFYVPKLDTRPAEFLPSKSFFSKVCCCKSDASLDDDFSHEQAKNQIQLQPTDTVPPGAEA
ncbi:hypothetical protein DI09_31p10, partial [Mitosporidium daphniae]